MDISVIVPLYNEEESIPELYAWIERVMKAHDYTFEVIFVNDGSTDSSWQIIEDLHNKSEHVKGIKFRRNYGKSPALYCGFKEAQGDVVITMDADLQDSPDEIPELYRMIKEDGYDLVSGYKQKRYIPYLAKNAGFEKIGEKVVQHQARKYGQSKFMGLNRFVNGYLDLLTLWFLSTFGKKPMHVFGFLGSIMFFIGFLSVIFIGADKMYALINGIPQRLITDSPWFYIALTTMLIGTQLFLSGFLGDLISRSSQNRNDYQIEKIVK